MLNMLFVAKCCWNQGLSRGTPGVQNVLVLEFAQGFVQLTDARMQPDQLQYARMKVIRATCFDLLSDLLHCWEHLSFAHQDEEHLL